VANEKKEQESQDAWEQKEQDNKNAWE